MRTTLLVRLGARVKRCCEPRTALAYADFCARLVAAQGEAALAYRHEAYFLCRKPCGGVLHAPLALAREVWWLWRSKPQSALPDSALAVVTLNGVSGRDTLARAVAALAPQPVPMLLHPRLRSGGMNALSLRGVSLRDLWPGAPTKGTGTALRLGERWVLFTCRVRHHLWWLAWQRFLAANPAIKTLLLHNDFDMMSSSGVRAAAAASRRVICVQHGIPTDEFFPTSASIQVVWGESSREVYEARSQATLVVDALGRDTVAPISPALPPQEILLISQTHTPVYGHNLRPLFEALALELERANLPLRVLLHPAEMGDASLYVALQQGRVSAPPHPELRAATSPMLVVGYSSTALLDAARAGHMVVGMGWPVLASEGAYQVCRPPVICQDAAAVAALYRQLQTDADARNAHHAQQAAWRARTFQTTAAFVALCRKEQA